MGAVLWMREIERGALQQRDLLLHCNSRAGVSVGYDDYDRNWRMCGIFMRVF